MAKNLSKTQEYAIKWLNSTGMDNLSIAKELKISVEQITSLVGNIDVSALAESKAKNLMITHTAGKKINSVAVMTKEASELGDTTRQTNSAPTREIKGIFRPKN